MSAPPDPLHSVFDRAFAGLSQGRETFTPQLTPHEVGTIASVSTGIARVSGLPGVGFDELVKFPGDVFGIAFNVDEDEIGVVLLGEYWHLHAGDEVQRTGRVMDVAVGDGLLGRVIDPLGRPLDGNAPVASSERLPIERPAAPIMDRAPVTVPLQTGLKVIDALIPIGRGQRELILGDRQTGKTAIAIDTILNQRGKDVLCVYCAIGQRGSAIAKAVATFRQKDAMDYTVVVVTEGNDPPGLAYIAPYAATSIAEHFMERGRDVLVVYDDLTHHARAYRELSLLLRRPPGREAFPGDIFYIHSRLLERATHLRKEGTRRRLAHSAAHHRNGSAKHFRLHSDQSDLHHRWADLPLAFTVRTGRVAGGRCRQIRFARWRQGATGGLQGGGGRPQARLLAI
jgi:F-type H+-transporting ATPase subunit alpha